MKRLFVIVGLLLFTGCTVRQEGHLYVKCWQRDPDGSMNTVIYSGPTNGGLGIANSEETGKSILVFKDATGSEVTISLINRVCGVAADD